MMVKHVKNYLSGAKYIRIRTKRNNALHVNAMSCHNSSDLVHEKSQLSSEWYNNAIIKVTKLSRLLRNVDCIDGRYFDIRDDSVIMDERVYEKMVAFKSLARELIGSRPVQKALKEKMVDYWQDQRINPILCFTKPSEREAMYLGSLTQVANFLSITAQQRKAIRVRTCRQVTEHHIWIGMLQEVLNSLKPELELMNCHSPTKGTLMAQQVVTSCLDIFTAISTNTNSTSWMRLKPKKEARSSDPRRWEEVFDMFEDLIECLKCHDRFVDQLVKLQSMKEGMSHLKGLMMDKSIGYKEVRRQEKLVKKNLSELLGFPSQCLFTLLLYYLVGQVRDIEVDLCGGVYKIGYTKNFCLSIGRVVTSGEERMVISGVKQLDRTLTLYKFVWECAGMKGVLNLQGHLWYVGAVHRVLPYNGKTFFVHGINIC